MIVERIPSFPKAALRSWAQLGRKCSLTGWSRRLLFFLQKARRCFLSIRDPSPLVILEGAYFAPEGPMHLPRGLIHSPQQNKQSARKPWNWPRAGFVVHSVHQVHSVHPSVEAPDFSQTLVRGAGSLEPAKMALLRPRASAPVFIFVWLQATGPFCETRSTYSPSRHEG